MTSKYTQAVIDSGWTPDQPLYLATDVVYDLLCDEARAKGQYATADWDETLFDQATQIAQRIDVLLNGGVAR
jgi:hypothetical protein